MKTKAVLITILLTIGLTTQYCSWFVMNCNCPPVEFPFFDVNGTELHHDFTNTESSSVEEGVRFIDYNGLKLLYNYDVLASQQNHNCKKTFSLMNEAYGCSCDFDGSQGSKEEKLKNVVITTLNNFDDNHLANDTINDLFVLNRTIYGQNITVEDYLQVDTLNIQTNKLVFTLTQPPVINRKLKMKITVELSTGEIYEAETQELEIK